MGVEGSATLQYDELRDEIHATLEEVLRAQKEAEDQTSRILNADGLEEAKQLYLIHQVYRAQMNVFFFTIWGVIIWHFT